MRKDTKNFIKSAEYDLKTAILEAYPQSVTEEYFCKTKEILECLKKHEMLKE